MIMITRDVIRTGKAFDKPWWICAVDLMAMLRSVARQISASGALKQVDRGLLLSVEKDFRYDNGTHRRCGLSALGKHRIIRKAFESAWSDRKNIMLRFSNGSRLNTDPLCEKITAGLCWLAPTTGSHVRRN
jgi:hypothetical protein